VASQFVLLRIENMRGVDLDLFDFDYDLTWAALFLNADGKVYGRYGGRHPDPAVKTRSLSGLRHALSAALEAHRREPPAAEAPAPKHPRTSAEYPAARRLPPDACVRCHNLNEFRHEAERTAGTWKLENVWVYPLPENLGLTLDVDRGDRVTAVAPQTPAARLGLKPGDVLTELAGRPVASIADVQYALHRAAGDAFAVRWRRGGESLAGKLDLPAGWRKTDVSWRWSLKALPPDHGIRGDDLTPDERRPLGLGPKTLALRQGGFLTPAARQAGLQVNDLIVGLDGQRPEMTARQFDIHLRLTYRPGDRVTLNVLRGGKPVEVPLDLPGR
jgi:serine protease Do